MDDLRLRRQAALEALDTPPHAVFEPYRPWAGEVDAGWVVDFLGVRTRVGFFSLMGQLVDASERRSVVAGIPVANEEYFEWIALLEAVAEAEHSFVMVELGAGWGRWMVSGIAALRQRNPLPYHVVGVEAEPTHFHWMQQHFEDNEVELGCATFFEAAVAAEDGAVWFEIGKAADWYGQRVVEPPSGPVRRSLGRLVQSRRSSRASSDDRVVRRVRAVSVVSILDDLPRVDFLDLDVQGTEADALEPAAHALMDRVKRVCVGTHGRENETRLRALFGGLGWTCAFDYPGDGVSDTPWGRILFEDGVQVWINPRL